MKEILTGDSEIIAEEGSAEGADDAGEDEVAGDPALVELRPPGGRPAAAEPPRRADRGPVCKFFYKKGLSPPVWATGGHF